MLPTASDHLALAAVSLAVLIAWMCGLDRIIFARPAGQRLRPSRPRPTFANREHAGETVLVDPDGQVSRLGKTNLSITGRRIS
ncbi:MAG TPA: hypothetical protein VKB38_03755 [Terracidiphilus sp.]|nr:hypothetical protein [Terracidiphilus sp.]